MNGIMRTAVLTKEQKISIEERKIPSPAQDEVLIKLKHVGICGSDIHYYEHGRIGNQVVKYPMVLGHECSGTVVKIGSSVKNIKEGDIVAVEPQYTCGRCEFCKTGRYNLCPDVFFMATPPNDGAFAEYVTHRADMVYKLPDSMDTVEGALIEPLAIGFNIARQAKACIGQQVHVIGAGCIGLVTVMALKSMGVTDITISDVFENRLVLARKIGAKSTFNASKQDVNSEIQSITQDKGVDIVIDASGNSTAITQTIQMVKRGGTIILVGYSRDDTISYDFNKLILKEACIITSRRYRNTYPMAIKAVSEGLAPVKDIVTNSYSFEQIPEAMEYIVSNKEDVIKAIVELN